MAEYFFYAKCEGISSKFYIFKNKSVMSVPIILTWQPPPKKGILGDAFFFNWLASILAIFPRISL